MLLKIGNTAPELALPDQDGVVHDVKDYRGQWLLIYFYPKDDTPGCTVEACALRDNFPAFKNLGITVLGISADTTKKHASFAKKYELPFTLLADEDKRVVETYGVWGKKKFMGREYMGISRTSFLVGPDGLIKKIYENVKPKDHAGEVLADVSRMKEE